MLTHSPAKRISGLLAVLLLLSLPLAGPAPAEGKGYSFPYFRANYGEARMPQFPPDTVLRLVADENFPPFSFKTNTGTPAGIAVELATSACTEMGLPCQIDLKPLPELLAALRSGRADAVLDGPRIDEQALSGATITRPWFRSLGRFAAQAGAGLLDSDAKSLAGEKIGVVHGTLHEAWLLRHYGNSSIVSFANDAEAQDALRTGSVAALFGDNLRLIYWVRGSVSRGCCKLLGGAHTDYDYFSRNAVFLVRGDRPDIRDGFDIALDRLQANGTTEKVFNGYVPLSPW
ncbi:MAG: transporter substrate-binding domain-containing protein [Alphaproteobacteria bacterium]|nr:transporter substrate-binding domain-containing protein [Alphaproteobacteria bacterium]